MKTNILSIKTLAAFLIASAIFFNAKAQNADETLYNKLESNDSLLFDAVFNTCNINVVENILGNDFAFYQDKGQNIPDVTQDRTAFINAIKDHFCAADKNTAAPKMKREIETGTLKVYPVSATEVLQTGIQHFYMLDPGANPQQVEVSRFTRTWNKVNEDWKMSKEFDAVITATNEHPHDALYDSIAHMDSILFNAYNHHDIETIKTLFTKDLEFYHDKGGLTLYDENMANFKKNFDSHADIHRTLVAGSLEVYPVPNYGAMEIGSHTFCHKENGKDDCGTFQFAMVWKRENGAWKISRVLSYGH
jgi:hypothetical protein